jgi:hypothetical protein
MRADSFGGNSKDARLTRDFGLDWGASQEQAVCGKFFAFGGRFFIMKGFLYQLEVSNGGVL